MLFNCYIVVIHYDSRLHYDYQPKRIEKVEIPEFIIFLSLYSD